MGDRVFRFLFKYPLLVFEQGDFTWGCLAPLLIALIVAAALAVGRAPHLPRLSATQRRAIASC